MTATVQFTITNSGRSVQGSNRFNTSHWPDIGENSDTRTLFDDGAGSEIRPPTYSPAPLETDGADQRLRNIRNYMLQNTVKRLDRSEAQAYWGYHEEDKVTLWYTPASSLSEQNTLTSVEKAPMTARRYVTDTDGLKMISPWTANLRADQVLSRRALSNMQWDVIEAFMVRWKSHRYPDTNGSKAQPGVSGLAIKQRSLDEQGFVNNTSLSIFNPNRAEREAWSEEDL